MSRGDAGTSAGTSADQADLGLVAELRAEHVPDAVRHEAVALVEPPGSRVLLEHPELRWGAGRQRGVEEPLRRTVAVVRAEDVDRVQLVGSCSGVGAALSIGRGATVR